MEQQHNDRRGQTMAHRDHFGDMRTAVCSTDGSKISQGLRVLLVVNHSPVCANGKSQVRSMPASACYQLQTKVLCSYELHMLPLNTTAKQACSAKKTARQGTPQLARQQLKLQCNMPDLVASNHCCPGTSMRTTSSTLMLCGSYAAVFTKRQLLDCCSWGHSCRHLKALPAAMLLYEQLYAAKHGAASCSVVPAHQIVCETLALCSKGTKTADPVCSRQNASKEAIP
jgi:hypothetical protein